MSVFRVEVEIAAPTGSAFVSAGRLIVDTGAEVSWVRDATLRAAGVEIRKPNQVFQMANGETVSRDVGYAIVGAQGFETVDEVVFAHEGDLQLLGARTLEGFNATVDPPRKRLVAAGPIVAARVGV